MSNTTKRTISPYESVLALTFLLLVVYHFMGYKMIFIATIAFVLLCLLSPTVSRWVHQAWTALTQAIGWVMTRVLMTIVFFVFLTPLAFLFRLFSKKNLDNTSQSFFIDRKHTFTPKDIESPW